MGTPQNWWNLQMPPNWEAKYDPGQKRYFYINHQTKQTTWEDPRIKQWQEQTTQPSQPQQPQEPQTSGTVNINFGQCTPHRTQPSPTPARQDNIRMEALSTWQDQDDSSSSVDKEKLAKLKSMFPTAEEWAVRKALSKCHNSEGMAITDLTRSGYKRQNVPHQMQDNAIVQKLKREFPTAEESVMLDVVQCLKRDEGRVRQEMLRLGYKQAFPSPLLGASNQQARAASPKPKGPTEAEKARAKVTLKSEFKDQTDAMIDVALNVAHYDLTTARTLLKSTARASTPKRTVTEAASTSFTTSGEPSTSFTLPLTTMAATTSDPISPAMSTVSTPSSTREMLSKTTSINSRLKSSSPKSSPIAKRKTETRTKNYASRDSYQSANRISPNGPDPNLTHGHDRELLLSQYVPSQGSNAANRCGPQASHVNGPCLYIGFDSSLAEGTNFSIHNGPDPEIHVGPEIHRLAPTITAV